MNKWLGSIKRGDKHAFIVLHRFVRRHRVIRGILFLGAEPLLPVSAGLLCLMLIATQRGVLLALLVLTTAVCWCVDALVGGVVRRQRPYDKMGARMRFIGPSLMKKSFPSEHTALSVIVAWGFYLLNPWWGGIALVVACWVALGRVGMGMHYPLDVAGGILTSSFTIFAIHYLLSI